MGNFAENLNLGNRFRPPPLKNYKYAVAAPASNFLRGKEGAREHFRGRKFKMRAKRGKFAIF